MDGRGVLAAGQRLVRAARAGKGEALFIIGELGLGKSTLLAAVAERATGTGVRVVRCQGDAAERDLALALVGQVISELAPALEVEVERAQTFDERALRDLTRRLIGATVRAVGEPPTLLAIDDLHWADADSLSAIAHLVRRLRKLPLGVVATLRTWPPDAERLCLQLADHGHASVYRLHPLSARQVGAILAQRLNRQLSDEDARRYWSLSGGNPLLITEIAAVLASAEDGETPAKVAHLHAGATSMARLAGLPRNAVLCAQAASVLGRRFRSELVIDVAKLDEAEGDAGLEVLCRSGLVREGPGRSLEFVQKPVWKAVYHELSPPLRTRLHARAFTALARRGFEVRASEHAVRANLSGSPEAIGLLAKVGQAKLRKGAASAAAEYFRAAVELAGDVAGSDLRLALGEALLHAGSSVAAASVLERLLRDTVLSEGVRADALRLLARAHYASGHKRSAATRLADAASLVAVEDPGAAAEMLMDRALLTWQVDGVTAAIALAEQARELAGFGSDATLSRIDACEGFVRLLAADPDGLFALEKAAYRLLELSPAELDDVAPHLSAASAYCAASVLTGRFGEAERYLDAIVGANPERGSRPGIRALGAWRALAFAQTGPLDAARDAAAAAVAACPGEAPFAEAIHGHVLLHMGNATESEAACARVDDAAQAGDHALASLWVRHVRAQRMLLDGDAAGAAAEYDELERAVDRLGLEEPCVLPWAGPAILAQLGCDRVDRAQAVLSRLETAAERLPCVLPRVMVALGCARLADRVGDADAAEREFQSAVGLATPSALALERVQGLWEFGAFLRRAGRRMEARRSLADALRLAETAGAELLGRHVARELTVAGGRRPVGPGRGNHLTPQETRIVELAAAGRSNREIAAHLHLSVNTVETHLQRAFAKLGVTTRLHLVSGRGWEPSAKPAAS